MYVVIPAKPLSQAKSRLAPVLAPAERLELSRFLLQRTITLARQAGDVVVISRDAAVRRLAKQAGAWALVETGHELNQALRQAAGWLTARGGRALLVLPSDLPLLHPADLASMRAAAAAAGPTVIIAPSRRFDGTNALLLCPPGLIPFRFGPDSFTRHTQAARAAGLEPVIYTSPTLGFDLDMPEDLRELEGWQMNRLSQG